MTRHARLVFPGCPHHVTQRGNRRQHVFRDDQDRLKFIALLKVYIKRYEVDIWSYVLMTNHIHLVAVPQTLTSLSSAMRDCLSDYALFFNRRYGYVGHLWQQRFYSSMLAISFVATHEPVAQPGSKQVTKRNKSAKLSDLSPFLF